MTATDTSRTRTYSWEDPAELARAGAGLTGLELMDKLAAGELPPPPIIAMLEGAGIEGAAGGGGGTRGGAGAACGARAANGRCRSWPTRSSGTSLT